MDGIYTIRTACWAHVEMPAGVTTSGPERGEEESRSRGGEGGMMAFVTSHELEVHR